MTQQTTLTVPAVTWTQITDGDVTAITFQVFGNSAIKLKGAASAVAPTDALGALTYRSGQGESNIALSALFPGITAVRIYVYSESVCEVTVGNA
jgi:hypothetical protein|tara:strand:- start:434 stop:715 length:282 start_codon:yes stop_codon:yes gene_type:complete